MANRLEACFESLRADGRKALVVYLTAGDPDLEGSVKLARACLEAGADILEWGVPFSDPTADGPVLQEAALRALEAGSNLDTVLEGARQIRSTTDKPIILFGYVNPLLSVGLESATEKMAEAGLDGALTVDAPPEASEEVGLEQALLKRDLCPVYLVTPLSTEDRLEAAATRSRGFVYAVSLVGITGTKLKATDAVAGTIETMRRHSDRAVCVGFGISEPEQAARLSGFGDGVVVGSALVALGAKERAAGNDSWVEVVAEKVAALRAAIDAA